jgi:type 1 glutamine amidotransferase
MDAVPPDFAPVEEWYAMRNYATNLHVLLIQDTANMVRGTYYAPNYPSTWARPYGKGRVFYTSMGHQKEVWGNPVFQHMLAGGMNWADGSVAADVSPNIDKMTPRVSLQ